MKTIRMLIVEDDTAILPVLKTLYREKFRAQGFDAITIEEACSSDEARSLARTAAALPYDLVSLDVNLGDASLTGLDVLSILRRFQAAWMVVLLTGAETDATLDRTMGEIKGDALRKRLRRDAYARFPAERLLVVEKPGTSLPEDTARELLANRLDQIAAVYTEVSRLRYIFRPIKVESMERIKVTKGEPPVRKFIETTSTHWQIRFNCGDIRTLPDKTGFRTLHILLSLDPSESLTPEAALAAEPAAKKSTAAAWVAEADPVAAFFQAKGIDWNKLDAPRRDELIRAALSLPFVRYQALRVLRDEEDLSPNEEDELVAIIEALGPLAAAAETAYLRMNLPVEHGGLSAAEIAQAELHAGGGANYDKLGRDRLRKDSPDGANFRARMKRLKECLHENGFTDFAQHLDGYIQSTGSNWSYNPPEGIEWTLTPS